MSPFASRIGRARRALAAVVWVALSAISVGVSAQPKSSVDEARALAREGWKALDAQDYKEALAKVTQAEALYHAPIHLLLMGNAQLGLGHLADALGTFERLAAEPLSEAAPTAFKEAQETGRKKMKELLSRVPSLLVAVENAESPATVLVDGKKVDFSSGIAVRMDPGEHALEVTAEGYDPAKRTITLPEKGGVVRVPILLTKPGAAGSASATSAATGSAAPTSSAAPTGSAGPGPTATATTTAGPVAPPSRVPAYVTFGLSGAAIVVGAVTGGLSLAATGDLKKRCPGNVCSPADAGALDSANVLANTSTATFLLGGLGMVAGITLMLVDLGSQSPPPRTLSATVEPWVSIGAAGVRGRF